MAEIVTFHTKAERLATAQTATGPVAVPTTPEFYQQQVLRHCREMTDDFKKSSRWDNLCEDAMIQVVRALQGLASHLTADTTGVDDAAKKLS